MAASGVSDLPVPAGSGGDALSDLRCRHRIRTDGTPAEHDAARLQLIVGCTHATGLRGLGSDTRIEDEICPHCGAIFEPATPYDREPIAPALTLQEGHLTASGPGTRLRLGQQLFSWGKADGFNPLDRLNPFDYTDLPQAERRSVVAASLEQVVGPLTFEGVFVPRFTPSRLPQPDWRWAVELPRNFPLLRRDLPPGDLANAQYASRASAIPCHAN